MGSSTGLDSTPVVEVTYARLICAVTKRERSIIKRIRGVIKSGMKNRSFYFAKELIDIIKVAHNARS